MNKNIKTAKELIKLAKELLAKRKYEVERLHKQIQNLKKNYKLWQIKKENVERQYEYVINVTRNLRSLNKHIKEAINRFVQDEKIKEEFLEQLYEDEHDIKERDWEEALKKLKDALDSILARCEEDY